MKTVTERLAYFIDKQEIKVSKLEKELGYGNGTISKAIARGSSIKAETIEKIVSYFPDLRKEWLLWGHGKMRKSDPDSEETNGSEKSKIIEEMKQRINTLETNIKVLEGKNQALSETIDKLIKGQK